MKAKKLEFKYPLDQRPPRRSLRAAAAAAKTFGVITWTAENAPKKTLSIVEVDSLDQK